MRQKIWDAYADDFCSRLLPGAPQIMITTRWHQDDPAGRILPDHWEGQSGYIRGRDGRAWNVLCCPAICNREDDPLGREIGEGLWPEWFPMSHWEPFQKNPRAWSSLYQQNPSPAEGTFFQHAWFEASRYDTRPTNLHIYATSDHARSEDAGDYTVMAIWGVDAKADLYWIAAYRGRTTPDKWMVPVVALLRTWKPFCWFAENDPIFGSVEPFIRRVMRDEGVACRIEKLSVRGDKQSKAQAIQGMASMGRVHFPRTVEADQFIDEYLRFPTGRHDDCVDCGSAMGRALMDAHPAIVQAKTAPPQETDPWGQPLRGGARDWRVA